MAEGFKTLWTWKKGYKLLMEIYQITTIFPDWEKYSLIQQIIKSANSIIANIAESHGRFYYLDKIRVLYISRGEAEETQSHLSVAFGQEYISEEKHNKLIDEYESLIIGINNQIKDLKTKSKK
jgi:four helix bundle protein